MTKKSAKQRKKDKALKEAQPSSKPPSLLMRPAVASAATTSTGEISGLPKTPSSEKKDPIDNKIQMEEDQSAQGRPSDVAQANLSAIPITGKR